MIISIYALLDPRDSTVRYIGQSVDPQKRYAQHLRCRFGGWDRNHEKAKWVEALCRLGLRPTLKILQECDNHDQANVAERRHIQAETLAGNKLVNMADGGGGCAMSPAKHATPDEWIAFGNEVKSARAALMKLTATAGRFMGAQGIDAVQDVVQKLDRAKLKFANKLFDAVPYGEFRDHVFYGDEIPSDTEAQV